MRGRPNPNPTPLEIVRHEAGLTRKQLEEKSGVSWRLIERYEQRGRDINNASVSVVRTLARALDVPIEKILDE